jgi:fumarylacetoacetate (FAA) hydrolase
MKLVTLKSPRPDGRLAIVSRDLRLLAGAEDLCPTLQAALDDWESIAPAHAAAAPLPRSYQWLDGSAFQSHGDLMAKVFNLEPDRSSRPLMYQGMSHEFLSAGDDVALPSEADGSDFEGEFGVLCDRVPMGVSVHDAQKHIRLIVQINDWSLRVIGPVEMKTGFGWVQAKPACSAAPVALTPDELGAGWSAGRVALPLKVWWNERLFGAANGAAMRFSFAELVAHAAHTRKLCAGTVVGSGTVSNDNFREVGSSCIAERRAIELLDEGAPRTGFMRFGDRVRMAAVAGNGTMPFGQIDQRVVSANHAGP